MMKAYTLCIVRKDGKILLGMKKRGFGAGRWNGFGGKLLPGEDVRACAVRELKEEAGIDAINLVKRAVITYSFATDPEALLPVHIFDVIAFSGAPEETEEMRPQWFTEDAIPYEEMWQSDRVWLPEFLKGSIFEARFHFKTPEDDVVLWHTITRMEQLSE